MNTATCSRPKCTGKLWAPSGEHELCQPHWSRSGHARKNGGAVPFPHEHVQDLIDRGYSIDSIRRVAGISHSTLSESMRLNRPLTEYSYRKLMNADMEQCLRQPAWRAQRRLRALAVIGIPAKEISAGTGISKGAINSICAGYTRSITRENLQKIVRFYQQHEFDVPDAYHGHVTNSGWAPPLQWDDIDDPDENHHNLRAKVTATSIKRRVADMRADGMTWAEIGDVFDTSAASITSVYTAGRIERYRRDALISAYLRNDARRRTADRRDRAA